MDKNTYFYLTVTAAILVILLGAFVFLNTDFSSYRYSVTRDNVDFVSNTEPSQVFQSIKSSETFVVSPRFVSSGPENSFMLSSITMFSAVLADKKKSVIVIGRVLDEGGNLAECQSNLGDVRTNESLALDECTRILNDSRNARIFVSFPDSSLERPRVLLENGVITITPSSFESVSHASFVVLESMYDDTREIIERVNLVVGRL